MESVDVATTAPAPLTVPVTPMSLTEARAAVAATIADQRDNLLAISHQIHDDPELSYQEFRSAALLADQLRAAGYDVTLGCYGLDTAFEAVIGEGDVTATLCLEYDALPKIGHACGHNIIATAGLGAAIALAPLAAEAGVRVKVLGTPAEEHGGGKVDMLRAGAWEDSTFSLMVHGMTTGDVAVERTVFTAVERFQVTFHGVASHAAGAPWLAVNAGAAATLSLTAMALLRQHIPHTANINAYISNGGAATNIIPDLAELQVEVRAADLDVHRDLKQRVMNCFEGAAIATGCTWEQHATENGYAPVKHDPDLSRIWDANLSTRGRTLDDSYDLGGGSTDMGNVSQVLPGLHGTVALDGCEAAPHQVAFEQAAASPAGDDAVLDAAAALAWTVLDVAHDPALRADLLARQAARPVGATTVDSI